MTGNQRWLWRRASYRPPEEPIRTRDYEVSEITSDREARAFVVAHHYSQSYPAARLRFGLYRGAELEGVAVFSVPARAEVLTRAFPGVPALDAVELGRFVLLDSVAGNGETWFLARCFELLRRAGLAGAVSFSDPMRREALDGRVITPGHVGTIYQAANAVYLGRSRAEALALLPDGTSFPRRCIAKIRSGDCGWLYSVKRLLDHGAEPPRCYGGAPDIDELRAWLTRWLPRLTRKVAHPGNHKYAWGLRRPARRLLPPLDPTSYPKRGAAA